MKHRMLLAAAGTGAIGLLAGCAKTTPVEGAPAPMQSVSAGGVAKWTANIQSVTQNRGDVQQTTRDRSYGSATWSHGEAASLSSISIIFNYNGTERDLSWAILPGSCGTAALPIIPMSNFPEINIAGGGRGQVTASLPMELPGSGTFHIDVYRDRRQGPDALIACGNLKYAGG